MRYWSTVLDIDDNMVSYGGWTILDHEFPAPPILTYYLSSDGKIINQWEHHPTALELTGAAINMQVQWPAGHPQRGGAYQLQAKLTTRGEAMKNAYLVGYVGWGSLENLHLALDCKNAEEAVDKFLVEAEEDDALRGHFLDDEPGNIFTYKVGVEQEWAPVLAPVVYKRRRR